MAVAVLTGLLGTMTALGASLEETFDTDPAPRGWEFWGDRSLFGWDAANRRLEVTWDSSRPNSFFALPLPSPLTPSDDFGFAFDLVLESHAVGLFPGQPSTFQIAAGLVRRDDVLSTNYSRGSFPGPRNTVEWAWFGESGAVSASVSPVAIPADGRLPWGYADSFVALEPGPRYHFELSYSASRHSARLGMQVDGMPGPALVDLELPARFTGFTVDAFAISSYSGAGQNPLYAGSVLAHGWIDSVVITLPERPVGRIRARDGGVALEALPGWRYRLEASGNLTDWTPVAEVLADKAGELELWDPRDGWFPSQCYRVIALRP